jgi:hypothetical protein
MKNIINVLEDLNLSSVITDNSKGCHVSDGSKLHDYLHENITHLSWIQRAQDKARWWSLVGNVV